MCHAVNAFDHHELPSMVGYGLDTSIRCRRCGSSESTDPMFGAHTHRAPWPPPRHRQAELDRRKPPADRGAHAVNGTTRGDDEFWPEEHEHLPAAWWRMPDDIRLQVRTRIGEFPDLAFAVDFYHDKYDSLSVYGSLYVNLAHLTLWDTYRPGDRPQRTMHQALTSRFPDLFTTVHHHNPGSAYLALRLHRPTDPVADAILAHATQTLTAMGIDPANPFLLRMP